jgi:hypothetical protein
MNAALQAGTAHRLFLLSVVVVLCGCAGFKAGSTEHLTPSEKMMWSTYAIGTAKGMATCVIVNRKDPSGHHGIVPMLVTATHVLAVAPRGPYFLAIRTPKPGGSPDVSILQFEPPLLGKTTYAQLPQQDVAAMELRIPEEMANAIDLSSFVDEDSIARSGNEARAGDAVAILGFPKVFPGTEGGFPVLRSGTIASYSPRGPSDRDKFLVHTNVYSGDSGAPVFAAGRRGRKLTLVGLMTERIGKKTSEVPLAVAVDATVIRETLELLAQRDRALAETTPAGHRFASNADGDSTVKLAGPRSSFVKVVHGKRPAALPIPVAPRD